MQTNKKNNKYSVIFEATGLLFRRLVNSYVNIDFNSHFCREEISVRRCFKCQKYGHSAVICRNEDNTCAVCADKHCMKDCTSQDSKCANCIAAKNNNFTHPVFSKDCPEYLKAIKLFQKKIDYFSEVL